MHKMNLGFLFWFFLVGIIVAFMQDLKRREVDNWLNLFLLMFSFVFLFFKAYFERDASIVFIAGFSLVIMIVLMNLFYYGRIFAGGDANLLVAMTAFFVAGTFYATLANIGVFLLLLLLSGSVYGLVYSLVLYLRNRVKVNAEMKKVIEGKRWIVIFGLFIAFFGFANFWFVFFGGLIALSVLLYVFAKGLEKVAMIRVASGKDLVEGDWLVEDVKVKGKVIRADWDGLTLESIELLKGKKRVLIKDGLPFVPAFLIAFLVYSFLKDYLMGCLV